MTVTQGESELELITQTLQLDVRRSPEYSVQDTTSRFRLDLTPGTVPE